MAALIFVNLSGTAYANAIKFIKFLKNIVSVLNSLSVLFYILVINLSKYLIEN